MSAQSLKEELLALFKLVLNDLTGDQTRQKRIELILDYKAKSKLSDYDHIEYTFFKALKEMYLAGLEKQSTSHPNLEAPSRPKTVLIKNLSHKTINADEFALRVAGTIEDIRKSGAISLQNVADALNDLKIPTSKAGKWHPSTVRSIESRLERIRRKADQNSAS